jgi:Mce-associated membrane protein
MEDDAGANRLTPHGSADSSAAMVLLDSAGQLTGAGVPDTKATEVTAADDPGAVTVASATTDDEDADTAAENAPERSDAAQGAGMGASRLSRRWLGAFAATLVLLAGTTGAGGYLALRAHRAGQAITRANAAAVVAAKDCVAATQPADAAALPTSQQKLSECSTRGFGAQAAWYGAILAEAYQTVNLRVEVVDMRAAVERNNDDGSIPVLVAFRTKVSQDGTADRENSYRLRVKMVPEDGQFKVAELDQVTK